MKVSRRAEYGLAAMAHLARSKNNKALSVRQISNLEKIPYAFLAKIFVAMEKDGLVLSVGGPNGGYALAKKPAEITAMDIVGLLDGINVVDCQFCQKSKKCLTKNVWGQIDGVIARTLERIKLSDLIK